MDERDVGFKKDKMNVKDKFGKEREDSNKIDGQNWLPTINKECKGDVKGRRYSTLDERDELQLENIKSEMMNIFKEKREKRKKGELQT